MNLWRKKRVNNPADSQTGREDPTAQFERRLQRAAQGFSYPPAPDIRRAVRQKLTLQRQTRPARLRLAVAGMALAIIAAGLLAAPPVRAAILDWLRIGAVQIWLVQPSATPSVTPRPGPTETAFPTLFPSSTPLTSVLDLSGETSLNAARAKTGVKISLPMVPSDLGMPDHVYAQDLGGPVVVLVWMEKSQPLKVRLVISETDASNVVFQKFEPRAIQQTRVNGQEAVWVDAPYMLVSGSGETNYARMVAEGHTLIWTEGKMTYRLETGEDLPEALRMAESMKVEP
jgi:hypothetical protein